MNIFINIGKIIMEKAKHILHVFDLDDSLIHTPTFAAMTKSGNENVIDINDTDYVEYFKKIKGVFWDVLSKDVLFKKSGDFIVPVNRYNNKPFSGERIDDFNNHSKETSKMFLVKDNIIVLNAAPGFYTEPETLGAIPNEPIVNIYDNVENKMILTGRPEKLRANIISILRYLNMSFPNYGLKLFMNKNENIESFKIRTILESIAQYGWDTIHFYEDRQDWLYNTQAAVAKLYPNVTFVCHLVTNVKNNRSLSDTYT